MLNPVLSNIKIDIGENFFDPKISKKYDEFLHKSNYPLKNVNRYFHETIQNIEVPGFDFQTLQINDLNNIRGNYPGSPNFDNPVTQRTYPGHNPYNEVLTTLTGRITLKNSILNWLFCFEWMYLYYKRTREVHEFNIILDMLDSAELSVMRFHFKDCFFNSLPELEFAFNGSFSETKTFDVGFVFNQLDIEMSILDFNTTFRLL